MQQERILDSMREVSGQSNNNIKWENIALFHDQHRFWFMRFYLRKNIGGNAQFDKLANGERVCEIELNLNNQNVKSIEDFVKLPFIPDTVTRKNRWQIHEICEIIAAKVYKEVGSEKCLILLKINGNKGYYMALTDQVNGYTSVVKFSFIPDRDRKSIYEQ